MGLQVPVGAVFPHTKYESSSCILESSLLIAVVSGAVRESQGAPRSHGNARVNRALWQLSAVFFLLLNWLIPNCTAQSAFGSQCCQSPSTPLRPLRCPDPAHVPGFTPILCLMRLKPYVAS